MISFFQGSIVYFTDNDIELNVIFKYKIYEDITGEERLELGGYTVPNDLQVCSLLENRSQLKPRTFTLRLEEGQEIKVICKTWERLKEVIDTPDASDIAKFGTPIKYNGESYCIPT